MTETRSRRRGAELEEAILDAAWAELTEVGYAALTIESVAARAATSKPVLYRRWPSKAALVLAAWSRRQPRRQHVPDTGSLRSDLLTLFTWIARRTDSMMSQMIAGVMAEAFQHPEVTTLLRQQLTTAPLGDTLRTIVARAAARGELAPVTLTARVVRVALDLVRGEAILYGTPVSGETLAELVDDVYVPLLRGLATERHPGDERE